MKDYQLTSKGRRALDNMRIELPASAANIQNDLRGQRMMLHVLTMIKDGADQNEMREEFASSISYQRGPSPTPEDPGVISMLEGILRLLEITDHITIEEYHEDEDPPDFMSEWEDHY